MGRAELEQAKWENLQWAEAYAAQERELRDLSAAVESELRHKQEQLELARGAKAACETVRTTQSGLFRDLEDFASKVSGALNEPSVCQGIVSTFQDGEGFANGAVSAAGRLVEELEGKCNSLSASATDYASRAQTAADSARDCWNNADRLQREIDNCPE